MMRPTLLLIIAVILTQCGIHTAPVCRKAPRSSLEKTQTLLNTAKQNWEILGNPSRKAEWPTAQKEYNHAVGILFDQIRCGSGTWSERAHKIGTSVSLKSKSSDDPEDYETIFPSSEVKVRMKDRLNTYSGIGISTVGWKSTSPVGVSRPMFEPPTGKARSITVFLDFKSPTPQWNFSTRWINSEYSIGSTSHKLTADWTSPIEFFWYMSDLDNLRFQNLFLPERFTTETGLYFLQAYDPNKIPIVMVHGLVSSPDAYRFIINDLSSEDWFRENYQIWLYNYPTGTAWLYNAMRFRQDMEKAISYASSKGPDTNLNKMVILSHSMGGLLTRTAVTDPGTKLYDGYFKKPLDQLRVKPATKELIRQGLLYKPLTAPKRVVFMAVPHQGSPLARIRGTSLLSNLIRLPRVLTIDLLDATFQNLEENLTGGIPISSTRPPTSVSSLSPLSRGFVGLKQMPLPKNITFHSIIGDRNKGNTPNSSDGVVPYWSSHITPVATEKIIPSNHSVPDHPEAAEEITRILLLHLKENKPLKKTPTPR